MNEVEYVLRIILRARDELATGLAKARTQLRGFKTDADSLDGVMKNLNANFDKFNTNVDGITKKLESWRATLRAVNDDGKGLSKTFDDIGKSAEASSRKVTQAAKTQEQLQQRARDLRKEMLAIHQARRDETVDIEFASKKYKQLADQLNDVALKMSSAARAKTPAQNWAIQARDAAAEIKEIDKNITDDAVAERRRRDEVLKQAESMRLSNVKLHNAAITRELDQQLKAEERVASERAKATAKSSEADAKAAQENAARQQEIIRLAERTRIIGQRVAAARERRGGVVDPADHAELQQIARDYDRLAVSVKDNEQEFGRFATNASRVRSAIKGIGDDSSKARRGILGLSGESRKLGENVATVDNKLRGLLLLAVVSFAEQLTTAVAGLSGELVSLASSAVAAGGALGGILAAGAAQALPVVGLLAGAVSRVKAVTDAFQQSQKLQQAQFTSAEKGSQKAIDQTNQLASANDTATAANERLAESRKDLTKAQEAGEGQLQDLILAEKEAALAAKGASLNVKEAQQALQQAVLGGASAVEIQQRQLAVDEARLKRTQAGRDLSGARSARQEVGGDIGKLPDVERATKALKDAERAANAASRGLDQAQDKGTRAAGATMTAAANLNFMLSQLSPAERRLYQSVQRIYNNYRRIFQGTGTKGSGIYGVIIDSFSRAVDAVDRVMRMPRVVRTVQSLANVIGKNIDKITAAFTKGDELDQFVQITKDAGENLGPLVDMALDLADAFTNIATTANPALQKLLEFLAPIIEKFLGITENKDKMEDFFLTGEKHLEAWINLILAIIGLFAALFGASADTGKQSIEDLTKTIQNWTKWIQDNQEKVKKFFEDSRDVVDSIAGVVEKLAVEIFKTFSPEHLKQFAEFIEKTLLPTLGDVVRMMGDITNKVLEFLNSPVGSFAAKFAIASLVFAQIATSAFGAAKYVGDLVGHFKDLGKLLGGIKGKSKEATDALKDFDTKKAARDAEKERIPDRDPRAADTGRRGGIRGALGRVFPGLAGGAAGGAAAEGGAAAAGGAAGAGGAALTATGIGAIVVAVVALLAVTGQLAKIWEATKDAASDFVDTVSPAFDDLKKALEDLGIHVVDTSDVFQVLWDILEGIAAFIGSILISVITSLGDVLGGVVALIIDVVAGVIEFLHGIADIWIGLFTGDFSQIKKGYLELKDGILDIIKGIIRGITGIFKGIVELFLAPFKAAWAAIKKWFGIDSPSKKAMQLGEAILDGIRSGLRGLASILTWPFRHAWSLIKGVFDLDKVEKLGKDIIDALGDGIRSAVGGIKRAAGWVWGRIKDAFGAAFKFGENIAISIVDGLKTLPETLFNAITDLAGKFLDIGKAIGGKIWDGIKGVVGDIGGIFGIGGGDDKDKKQPAAQAPARARTVETSVQGPIPFGAKDLDEALEMWRQFWRGIRGASRDGDDFVRRQFRLMRIGATESTTKMYEDIRSNVAAIQNSITVRGRSIRNAWEGLWNDLMKVSYDGLNYIAHQTNLALKGLGEKNINFGLTIPKTEKKQRGGIISGWGDGDKIHVMAEPGEGFINKRAVAALGGPGVIDAINRMIPRFQGGGIVPIPGQPGESISSTILGDVVKLIKQYKLIVYDGFGGSPPHAANSDHKWGGAIDVGPGPGGSWDLVDRLAHWAEPTQGSPISPFRWVGYDGDPGHGRGNHLHLSWLRGAHLAGAAAAVTQILRPLVTGPAGAMKSIAQAALDMSRKAANTLIEKTLGATAEPGEAVKVTDVAAGAENIFKFFRGQGFTDEQAAGWVGNFTQESGLRPGAIQPNGQGHGLAQWGGGRFAALQAFAAAHSKPWQDLGTQLAFVMAELRGPESGAYTAIKSADSLQAAVDAIGSQYERYGIRGDRYGPAMSVFRKFAGKFAEGGVVPGGDGTPMGIIAHAGEWILNKFQQSNLANMLGMSREGLSSMLGFHGGAHMQGGGDPGKRATRRTEEITKFAESLLGGDQFQSVMAVLLDIGQIFYAFKRLGKITKSVKGFTGVIDVATREGGLFDQLRAAIERTSTQARLKIRQAAFTVGAGGVVAQGRDVVRTAAELAQTRAEREDLTLEKRQIDEELKAVNRRLARRKLSKSARELLEAQRNNLQQRQDDAAERVQQNVEDIFAAQEAATQAIVDEQQKFVDDIKSRYSRALAQNDIFRRMATAIGNADWLKSINLAQQDILTRQANELEAQMNAARAAGAGDLANQLQDEVADLRAQVFEMAQQAIKDAADAINQAASRRLGRLDLFGRMADALGVVGNAIGVNVGGEVLSRGGVFAARGAALEQQRAGLQGVLGQAATAGNMQLVQDLTDQLAELDVTIAENTKAAMDARIEDVNSRFDFSSTMNDLNRQLIEATDAVTGQTSTAALLANLQEKHNLLLQHGLDLDALLADATPGTKTYQELQQAILENRIALQQNTLAVNEATGAGSAPQSFSSTAWQWFGRSFFGGTGQVLPQYNLPGDLAGLGPMGSGGGGPMSSVTNQNGKTFVTKIEVNEAGQPIDPTKLASTVVFAQATAQ